MADEPTEPVQGDEPQGGDGSTGAPYQEYLDRIPEEVRSEVEPVFKDWDANYTRRSQEHADYKRGWEPYDNLGVTNHTPEEVEWALRFKDALANPQAIKDWYGEFERENGLAPPAGTATGDDEYIDPATQALVEQRLKAELGPLGQQLQELAEWRSNQERQAQEAQAQSAIRSQMDEIKSKHPDEFNEPMIEKFIAPYIQKDPEHAVQRAFADWQAVRNQLEKDFLQAKSDAPTGGQSGGGTASGAEPISTLAQAATAAMEQLRAGRTT